MIEDVLIHEEIRDRFKMTIDAVTVSRVVYGVIRLINSTQLFAKLEIYRLLTEPRNRLAMA
jgi:alpha-glucuronidase